ncbi:MAG: hypothetical protein M0Z71_06410 [Nitrospiraceae bacterium]|nr:hypothetical protein [Nitrospiraceae bacterium]
MGIVTKTVGKGEYAYLVTREGRRVVHRYLGPAGRPDVKQLIEERKDFTQVPERFRSLFWDTALRNIQLKKHARNIIERVLEYGSLDAISWIQRVYPAQTIMEVLRTSRAISEKSRGFWEIWFGGSSA